MPHVNSGESQRKNAKNRQGHIKHEEPKQLHEIEDLAGASSQNDSTPKNYLGTELSNPQEPSKQNTFELPLPDATEELETTGSVEEKVK